MSVCPSVCLFVCLRPRCLPASSIPLHPSKRHRFIPCYTKPQLNGPRRGDALSLASFTENHSRLTSCAASLLQANPTMCSDRQPGERRGGELSLVSISPPSPFLTSQEPCWGDTKEISLTQPCCPLRNPPVSPPPLSAHHPWSPSGEYTVELMVHPSVSFMCKLSPNEPIIISSVADEGSKLSYMEPSATLMPENPVGPPPPPSSPILPSSVLLSSSSAGRLRAGPAGTWQGWAACRCRPSGCDSPRVAPPTRSLSLALGDKDAWKRAPTSLSLVAACVPYPAPQVPVYH
ncbi:hypothetical protein LY76DRAFT_595301 [Colletotrichum caudatum]|nr:hypothetical protein LY76DRAFT_595301 [Colletotrichum caudatum]